MSGYVMKDGDGFAELAAANPLAWIQPTGAPHEAMPMPVLLEQDATGAPVSLLGHLPRRLAMTERLAADGSAVFLFQGPHAYISPEWISNRRWAPTWNFTVAVVEAEVSLDDALTDKALRDVVAHMERGRSEPWTVDLMGERYDELRKHVIGFRAEILAVRTRMKLGQDENDVAFREILERLGDDPIAKWMREAR